MADKMREEFEAWVISFDGQYPIFGCDLTKIEAGDYICGSVQACWIAWQASREALVIELPDADGLNREHILVQGFLEGVLHTRVVIEAAGLKVKP